VLRFSFVPNTKLTPQQLRIVIKEYSDEDRLVPPEIDDLAKKAGAGRAQVAPVVAFLRDKEVAQGQKENRVGTVKGDFEWDGHDVAKIYVSPGNQAYQHLLPKSHATNPKPYYILYIRVAGVKQRGNGKLFIAFFKHHVLLPPKSRPPPESFEELVETEVVKRVGKRSHGHADGAQGFRKLAKLAKDKKKVKAHTVVHSENQFTKRIRKVKGFSGLAGTQSIDRTWKEMDRCIPSTMNRKTKEHTINTEIYQRVWSWLWRYNNAPCLDGFTRLGGLVNWNA